MRRFYKKRITAVLLICVSLFFCVTCAYTPAQRYVDFIVDLNITERFTDCFTRVEQGDATLYTVGELESMQKDLSAWDRDYKPAKRANYYFDESIKSLLASIEYTGQDMAVDAQLAYDKALEQYREGEMQLYRINIGEADA